MFSYSSKSVSFPILKKNTQYQMQSLNPKLLIEDILTVICIIAVTINSGNLSGEVAVQYK